MPFRSPLFPAAVRLQKSFHTSLRRRADNNHYKTLQVPTNASPQEIKKSFYALSKAHHPDHNPNDPTASSRFVSVSEAYNILGTPSLRQKYDLEVMHIRSGGISSPRPEGSYHSSNPAGGRPARGLSRRRTHFQGPPPSFYRGGGWGDQTVKRQAAQEGTAPREAGMGPGQQPLGDGGEVPHFDREGHFRTQTNHERRWQRRREGGYTPAEPSRGVLADFIFVAMVVSIGLLVPSLMLDRASTRRKAEK